MDQPRIKFLLLEDDKSFFTSKSQLIKNLFKQEGIKADQIIPKYSDVLKIIKGYNNFRKIRGFQNGKKLPDDIFFTIENDIKPIANDIIYFIDVNWTNIEGERNGLDFFLDHLSNEQNVKDAIALTVYSIGKAYDRIQHVTKSSSNLNEELWNRITNTNVFNNLMRNVNIKDKDIPIVVILTAIKEEYLAVMRKITNIHEIIINDTNYEEGMFEFKSSIICKVVIRECGPRNSIAIQETERAIHYFKPNCMLFVGIAGSRKPNDFGLGDVIFPSKIYSYEGGKSEKDSFLSRPELVDTSYAFFEIAKRERRKEDWKVLINNDIEKSSIKADIGVIASGEQIVEHFDSNIGRILTDHFNDTSAVEMEGFGFAKAASRQGRDTNNMQFGVIRGISDLLVQSKITTNNTIDDSRPSNAKILASETASAFAFWLILKLFDK